MNVETIKETFFELVSPDIPNEWDVEEALEGFSSLGEDAYKTALKQVPVIWPVSHSLCFDYLKNVVSALDCLEPDSLSEWVNKTLDQYEKQGLRAAQKYMSDVEENFLCPLRGEKGTVFKEVAGRLLPYLRGLSGKPLDLGVSNVAYTDTTTVYVPPEITLFDDPSDNIFLYKLIVTFQWAFIHCGSYTLSERDNGKGRDRENIVQPLWLQNYLDTFTDPQLAGSLYHLFETIRVSTFLEKELPGLMRRKELLVNQHGSTFIRSENVPGPVHLLQAILLDGETVAACSSVTDDLVARVLDHKRNAVSAFDSVRLTRELFQVFSEKYPYCKTVEPFPYQGTMRLDAVRNARDKRVEEARDQFVEALALQLLKQNQEEKGTQPGLEDEGQSTAPPDQNGVSVVIESRRDSEPSSSNATVVITIDNEQVSLDDELQHLANNIIDDLGFLPQQYISSAVGKAGKGFGAFQCNDPVPGSEVSAPVVYDEWDYRRNDFRKKWCNVIEKKIPLTMSSFYAQTMNKYHGQIVRLRYQFEMMRTSERFVRRQRDGDDIDLDSLIESVADAKAGLAPSDRLFIRLQRDERDIAVLFLIDMSNSTQGWVNETIKESLVLLCEALEVVGDSYGIYGFSGMRRLRSEFFHIKHLDEPYGDVVKGRISSIAPREYTRMGPALRHATKILSEVECRTRLLITLSDGKPEDYDDYKGEYAIEDTRHALIEAKVAGIHPFCITVDRHAQDYIDHMYGNVNYIQIDDVKKLPHRMPEIYRMLTS